MEEETKKREELVWRNNDKMQKREEEGDREGDIKDNWWFHLMLSPVVSPPSFTQLRPQPPSYHPEQVNHKDLRTFKPFPAGLTLQQFDFEIPN